MLQGNQMEKHRHQPVLNDTPQSSFTRHSKHYDDLLQCFVQAALSVPHMMMQTFDVDTASELLPPANGRTSDGEEVWVKPETLTAKYTRQKIWLVVVTVLALAGVVIAVIAAVTAEAAARRISSLSETTHGSSSSSTVSPSAPGWGHIKRLAYSSCTSYDVRPQPIWTEGVIPSNPDAWVWLGDFAYFDDPLINCNLVPSYPQCNCTADWMRSPPFGCFAGVTEHARLRAQLQLGIREYKQFLSFMCPGYQKTGVFPPWGTDPAMCPRPIFGVYDDHDSGWNNGNTRNPAKDTIKNIFLDAVGEVPDSPRRSTSNGLQVSYTLPGPGGTNKNGLKDEIQMVLLDERYFRETLPCSKKRDWCQQILAKAGSDAGSVAYCKDYLGDGSPGNPGSCCKKDDEWDAWCGKAANRRHPRWTELCDPVSRDFAQEPRILGVDNQTVYSLTDDLWDNDQEALWNRLVEGASSPLCEVLGLQQRQWLQEQLQDSNAALRVIGSGSVLAGSIGWVDLGSNQTCSGDDLACWPRAQVNLLHTVANASGCSVLLVGDFHYSDLKVIKPGGEHAYADALQTAKLSKPVYQSMASGMTFSTAEHKILPCEDSFREDLVGLRPGGKCSYVSQPAFGMMEVDWERRIVSLSVRNHTTGQVANGHDGNKQLLRFDLDSCEML